MIRVAWNMNKSSFQKNFYFIWKILTSKIFEEHEKIFSAQSDQSNMKRRVKLFLGNIF